MRLGTLECEGDELGEVGETLLGVRTEVGDLGGEHEQRSPEATAGRDGRNDGRSVAGQSGHPCRFARDVGVVVDSSAEVGGAVHRAVRVAVGDVGSDLDAHTLAVTPAADDDSRLLVEPHRGGRPRAEKPAGLLGHRLEHLARSRSGSDERGHPTEGRLLLDQSIRRAAARHLRCPCGCVHAITLARGRNWRGSIPRLNTGVGTHFQRHFRGRHRWP